MTTPETPKAEILRLTREYCGRYTETFALHPIRIVDRQEGSSIPLRRVFTEDEVEAAVSSTLDFG